MPARSDQLSRWFRWLRPLGAVALTLALTRCIVAAYFSAEVVPVPINRDQPEQPLTHRVVLLVIDGLRYDTALTSGWMPELTRLAARGAAGLSLTGQVTMTGVGVRCIGTGVSSSLSDLLHNVDLQPVEFDNLFARLAEHGGRSALVGDRPAWMGLFGRHFAIDETAATQSRLLHFINNVDGADRLWVEHAVALMKRSDWQLAVIMLGGIDHASHRWTPFSPEFQRKARTTDGDIASIAAAAGDDTTLIVTSDHGTGDRGHHGSGEPLARRTPLVLVGSSIRAGVRVDAQQVDIAPTIATLLGLPVPAPSEGRVLVEALAVDPARATRIEAANVAQLQRYADAYAHARGVTAPVVAPAMQSGDIHVVHEWLEAIRERASLAPIEWALALALFAIALIVEPRVPTSATSSVVCCVIVIGIAMLSALDDGRSSVLPSLALGAAVLSLAPTLSRIPGAMAARWLLALGVLLAIEYVVGISRIEHRTIELRLLSITNSINWSLGSLLTTMTIAALALIAIGLRCTTPHQLSVGAVVYVVIVASVAGDSLALVTGMSLGALACLAFADLRDCLPTLTAMAIGTFAALLVDAPLLQRAHLDLVAPLGLGIAALAALWQRKAPALLVLVLMAGAVTLAATGGSPVGFHIFICAGGLLVILVAAREPTGTGLEVLGWGSALLLCGLSRSGQSAGLMCWTLCASLAGRMKALRNTPAGGMLLVASLIVTVRLGFFYLFEGRFEINRLEVWVGYLGNPGTEHLWGATLVILKFTLPMLIAVTLITSQLPAQLRADAIGCCAAFWLLRVTHIIGSMTIARTTFYSPYADVGHLMYMLLMVASMLAVTLILTLVVTGSRLREVCRKHALSSAQGRSPTPR